MTTTALGWCKHCKITLFWDKRPGHALLPYQDSSLTLQHKCIDYQKEQAERGRYEFRRGPEIDAEAIRLLLKRIERLEAIVQQLQVTQT